MSAPYSPVAVANEFIELFAGETGIEHMKLQKLTYCAYGWWLASRGLGEVRLVSEGPEIWRHGPVFPSLYRAFKVFGRSPIKDPKSLNPFGLPERVGSDDDALALIRWVWGRYGHLSGFALSDLTHKPGSPWHRVAVENDFKVEFNTRIPDEYILEEFQMLLAVSKADAAAVRVVDGEPQRAT